MSKTQKRLRDMNLWDMQNGKKKRENRQTKRKNGKRKVKQ